VNWCLIYLGQLTSLSRSVPFFACFLFFSVEKWSPYEIALFEACITLNGKNFHKIQKYIQTKTVKEIIEFYYEWKKTQHYKEWKKSYFPDERDFL
jgi:hypothetical protein